MTRVLWPHPHNLERGVFEPEVGWRRRHLFAALRLRPPMSEHTRAEGQLLQRRAAGARVAVEIGVREGVSAWELRRAIAGDGRLYLIDPYAGRLGISMPQIVAKRLVGSVPNGEVIWINERSRDAAQDWRGGEIDFLFIDGDHSLEAVRQDWRDWGSRVGAGGAVAFHGGILAPPMTQVADGPVMVVQEIMEAGGWDLIESVDSTAVVARGRK